VSVNRTAYTMAVKLLRQVVLVPLHWLFDNSTLTPSTALPALQQESKNY